MKTLLVRGYCRLRRHYSHSTTMRIGRIVVTYPFMSRMITLLYFATLA